MRRRTISSEELTKLCLERIRRINVSINSFITVTEETAMAQARDCDKRLAKRGKDPGALFSVPVALRDNIDTAQIRTTAASRVFFNRVPQSRR